MPGGPSMPSGSAIVAAEHLVAAAEAEHGAAAAEVRDDVDVEAGVAQRGEIGDGGLGAGQDDERGVAGQCGARADAHEIDCGSASSGSRSSKLAMCGRIGTAMLMRAPLGRRASVDSASASSAGSRRALGEEGDEAERLASRSRGDQRHAVAKSAGSPRNLLTRKPWISAASSGSSTAWCRRGWR